MPEKEKRIFAYRDLATILVHADIHEGHWALCIEFGLGAANVPIADADGVLSLKPVAIVPVNSIGIQKHNEPSPLTVDAAEANPASAVHTEISERRRKRWCGQPRRKVVRPSSEKGSAATPS